MQPVPVPIPTEGMHPSKTPLPKCPTGSLSETLHVEKANI